MSQCIHTYTPPLNERKSLNKLTPSPSFLSTWKGPVPVPTGVSLEALATVLVGEDKELFLDLLSGLLCWLPEARLNASQAYCHVWLRGNSDE